MRGFGRRTVKAQRLPRQRLSKPFGHFRASHCREHAEDGWRRAELLSHEAFEHAIHGLNSDTMLERVEE